MPRFNTKTCCVPNCGKTRMDGTILHIFPHPEKDSDRFRTWLYAIGGNILALDNNTIYKYQKVCHNHFQARFYTASNRLSANATPTQNLPGPLAIPKYTFSEVNIEEPSCMPGIHEDKTLRDDENNWNTKQLSTKTPEIATHKKNIAVKIQIFNNRRKAKMRSVGFKLPDELATNPNILKAILNYKAAAKNLVHTIWNENRKLEY